MLTYSGVNKQKLLFHPEATHNASLPDPPAVPSWLSHRYRGLGRNGLLFVLDRHWKRSDRSFDPDDFTYAQTIAAVERITCGNFRLLERLFPAITRVLKINQLETSPNG